MSKETERKLLIIGYVWPEPNSSAAGSRMMQLIEVFLAENYQIVFATPAQESEHRFPLEELGVSVTGIELNSDSFDVFVQDLMPTVVLFDRFMMEEQFGWRVVQNCPEALRLLDTEDLHCLRKARHQALKEKRAFELSDLNSDIAKREVASIYRCDLSLMISNYEMELLENHFKVPKEILYYLPFLLENTSEEEINKKPNFEERENFICVGSFLHEPNWDCVRFIKEEIWPRLRKNLPKAEMHVYGSYPTQKAIQLHNPKENFYIKGWADNAKEVVSNARVCLAPLRFGAGIKGKFVEAMYCGTPSITTEIGAESMQNGLPWNGFVTNDSDSIVEKAQELYTDKEIWLQSQKNGVKIINKIFSKKQLSKQFIERFSELLANKKAHRKNNFTGAMLLHHTMRSTEYMSRWISEKNK